MNHVSLFLILNLAFLLSLNAKPKIYLIKTVDKHDNKSTNTYAVNYDIENVNKSEISIEADNSSEIMSEKRRAGKASDGGWSEWGACSKTSGPGIGMKTRNCTSKGRWDCRGPSRQPCCTRKPFCDFLTPDATDVHSKYAEAYMKEIEKKNPGFKLVEGDMILNRNQQKTFGKKTSNADYENQALVNAQWPNNTLYYTFDNTVSERFRNNIRSAVAELRGKLVGCIEIVEGIGPNYAIVSAKRNRQCVSMIGVNRFDKNTINFDEMRCDHKGVIQHEFIHALGIFHHQSRKDRDKYIKINWKNIETSPKDMTHNFLKQETAETYNLPYDYTSIMHYGGTFFSKRNSGSNKLLTIETKDPKYQNLIGRQDHISDGDIKLIKTYYGCKKDNKGAPNVSNGDIVGKDVIGEIGKGRRFDHTTIQVTTPSKKASGYTECCTVCQAAAPDTSLYMYNSQEKRCYCRKPLPGMSLITNVARSEDVAGFCDK